MAFADFSRNKHSYKDINRIHFTLSKVCMCVFAEEFMLTTLCDMNTMRYINGRKHWN